MTSAYPLEWPEGWPRTEHSKRKTSSPFQTTFDKARRELQDELRRLGAKNVVISSWLPLRQDGNPRADYFTLRERPMVMARDAFWSVHDNLRSIGLAIEHLRGLERHGGGTMMDRAFEGFTALPAPGTVGWRTVLGDCATLDQAKSAYRKHAMASHPDNGGTADAFQRVSAAWDEAQRFFQEKRA